MAAPQRLGVGLMWLFGAGFLAAAANQAGRALGAEPGSAERSASALRAAQCLIGLPLALLPGVIDRHTRLGVPVALRVLLAAFVFMSLVLGSAYGVYWLLPHWDTLLHAWSATMLVLTGLGLAGPRRGVRPLALAAVFAFAFAALGGVLWEYVEFAIDGAMGLNMQRFLNQDGTPLVGRAALLDTMGDLGTNSIAALGTLAVLAIPLRDERAWLRWVVPHWRTIGEV